MMQRNVWRIDIFSKRIVKEQKFDKKVNQSAERNTYLF